MGSRNQKPWPFEVQWRGRLDLATKVLSDLQDFWLRSQKPFPTRQVVAVLIRIFSIFPGSQDWHRSANDWLSMVGPPETECELLSSKSSAALIDTSIAHASFIVSAAAEVVGDTINSRPRRGLSRQQCAGSTGCGWDHQTLLRVNGLRSGPKSLKWAAAKRLERL
jgi:hypothetical protein